MKVLLDTNALLWWLTNSPRLSDERKSLLADPASTVYVSSVSAVEIAIKTSLGKLPPPPEPVAQAIARDGFEELPFTIEHGEAVAALPWHHKDPFDRMLIAQALVEGVPIMSGDHVFSLYGIQVV
ncbi:MAG: type II toxin-antitoxin system VapC family toxin [Propionibacteriaceae bacterium]|jgi:PIN domain nuclease of toxin-antitoxin system|nr:type II toxin-antitoxin system VapC family toxin [Propionibacteriaceae bacterium]